MSALRKVILSIFICLVIMGSAVSSWAIPTLQLDIGGGTYDTTTQTIVASDDPFTLYAYLIPDAGAPLADTYYLSAAVVPQVGPVGQDLGSFSFNGVPIGVTSGMVYGDAPIETYATQSMDPGDLQKHSIFETYFTQFAFNFDTSNRANAYNTQDTPGVGPTPNANGAMYYQSFTIDTQALNASYYIHFDLYNSLTIPQTVCTGKGNNKVCQVVGNDIDINSFAPFSHDAQSTHEVPEPMTLILLGLGLLGLGSMRRKFKA